ncbi:alpha/beta fold hydrolase [Streptomyces roseirectus]|uniref:Alpha/beta fold hydrolase n=1 Tax=Streptomyces roseirectus TaxID=2768066 RepID=A0A7H0IAR6_9ACTN|nr:alpha/beta hydrolase [Streptomyces roseirectus]QNP69882.1 alpha/beta fold hydrolase [Streptomyces roseirectus]
MHRYVDVTPTTRLWTEEHGAPDAPPLLLVMGAQASGLGWPDPFVELLAARHRVIRYDHRDTGRSTWAFDEHPYPITALAEDAVAVLDAYGIERAHVVGLSLGGMLTQLLLADHPERLLSATVMGAGALSETPYEGGELPGIDPKVLELWGRPVPDDLTLEQELDRRVEHWRVLHGDLLPFDPAYARALEAAIIEHTGHHRVNTAHGRADSDGMLRTRQLAENTVPTLVTDAPAEPVFPPPHPRHLVQVIKGARLVEIPGMGHALPPEVWEPLTKAILEHTAS